MSRPPLLPKVNEMQQICMNLPDFQIHAILRSVLASQTDKDDEIDLELKELRDSNLSPDVIWDEASIRAGIKSFYEHPSLRDERGNKIASIAPDGEFADYLVAQSTSDIIAFRTTLFKTFGLLCKATVATKEKKESFFSGYPPTGNDLNCLGGNDSRSEESQRSLEANKEDRYFIDALICATSQLTEETRQFTDGTNTTHSKRYIEYIVPIKTRDEAKKTDGQAFSTAPDIPLRAIAEIYEEFPKLFKKSLIDSISDKNLEEESQAAAIELLSKKIKEAVKLANDEGKDSEGPKEVTEVYKGKEDVREDLFDNEISEVDYMCYPPESANPRVSLAIQKLFSVLDLNQYDYFTEEGKVCKLNQKKLKEDLSKKIFNEKVDGLKKTLELFDISKAVSVRANPISRKRTLPKPPLSSRILSENIKQEIEGNLSSDDPQKIAWAIDVLHILSTKIKASASIHFLDVINHGSIYRNLISLPGKNPPILPEQYIEKITNPEMGIVVRRQEYESQLEGYNALLGSDACTPQDRLAAVMTVSTELALSNIDFLYNSGQLKESLTKKPDLDGYPWVGIFDAIYYKELLSSLILRGDSLILLRRLLDYKDQIPLEFFNDLLLYSAKYNIAERFIAKLLTLENINPGVVVNEDGDNSLMIALAHNKGGVIIMRMIDRLDPADINKQNTFANTALHLAVQYGYAEAIEKLIAGGANVNQAANDGFTPLHLAAQYGHAGVIEKLIAAEGVEVDQVNDKGNSPLHLAARNGHIGVIRGLIAAGAKVNQKSTNSLTALHLAAQYGHAGAIEELITVEGVEVGQVDDNGNAPLHLAARYGHIEAIRKLIEGRADVNQENYVDQVKDKGGNAPLHLAALNGHIEAIERLIEGKAEVNQENYRGNAPLHAAAQKGHIEAIKRLIERGAKVNQENLKRNTPLHAAAQKGRTGAIEELIAAGAEVNQRNIKGLTALHVAAQSGHTEVIRGLIAAGVEVNQADDNNFTALQLAAFYDHAEAIEKLIAGGADVNQVGNDSSTALHLAAQDGHIEAIEKLIAGKADVNQADDFAFTALHLAAQNGHTEVIERLIAAGANVNQETKDGANPLMFAARYDKTESLKALLRSGAAMKGGESKLVEGNLSGFIKTMKEEQRNLEIALNKYPSTLENYLITCKSIEDLSCLLNFQNKEGRNALFFAAESGWDIDNITTLIMQGADPNIINKASGSSFVEFAFNYQQYEVLNFLLVRGEEFGMDPEKIKKSLNSATSDGKTLFEKAMKEGDGEMRAIFIDSDIKYNDSKLSVMDGAQAGPPATSPVSPTAERGAGDHLHVGGNSMRGAVQP